MRNWLLATLLFVCLISFSMAGQAFGGQNGIQYNAEAKALPISKAVDNRLQTTPEAPGAQIIAASSKLYLPIQFKEERADPTATLSAPTATQTATATATATLSPSAQPTSTPNPIGHITILDIKYASNVAGQPDEYVEFKNTEQYYIQLQGWTLSDNADHTFTFPAYSMAPQQICRVYTNEIHAEYCGFSFGSGEQIWNTKQGHASIYYANGALADEYCYGAEEC